MSAWIIQKTVIVTEINDFMKVPVAALQTHMKGMMIYVAARGSINIIIIV